MRTQMTIAVKFFKTTRYWSYSTTLLNATTCYQQMTSIMRYTTCFHMWQLVCKTYPIRTKMHISVQSFKTTRYWFYSRTPLNVTVYYQQMTIILEMQALVKRSRSKVAVWWVRSSTLTVRRSASTLAPTARASRAPACASAATAAKTRPRRPTPSPGRYLKLPSANRRPPPCLPRDPWPAPTDPSSTRSLIISDYKLNWIYENTQLWYSYEIFWFHDRMVPRGRWTRARRAAVTKVKCAAPCSSAPFTNPSPAANRPPAAPHWPVVAVKVRKAPSHPARYHRHRAATQPSSIRCSNRRRPRRAVLAPWANTPLRNPASAAPSA